MSESIEERFWSKVDVRGPDACWPWTAGKDHYQYGAMLGVHGTMVHASRIVWELTYGPIPEGLCVLHRCDNRPCVNPAHLFLGTKADNSRDMATKGRWRNQHSTRLTEADVREIRRLAADGVGANSIGRAFGIHHKTVYDIVRRTSWRHVE